MKPWKQTKILTCNGDQSVVIEPTEGQDGIIFNSNEETDLTSFQLYMSKEEAIFIGEELIKFAQSL